MVAGQVNVMSVDLAEAHCEEDMRPVTREPGKRVVLGGSCVWVVVLVVGSGHLGAQPPPPMAAEGTPLPSWEPGDWFRLTTSEWSPGSIPDRLREWTRPFAQLLTVLEPEPFFGYECCRLRLTDPSSPESPPSIHYLLAGSGLRVRSQQFRRGYGPGPWLDRVLAAGPAWANLDPFPFPGFPLIVGESRTFTDWEARRADGTVIGPRDQDARGLSLYGGVPLVQSVAPDPRWPGVLRVTLRHPSQGQCTIRWLVGKPWWVQAWWVDRGTGYRRWALAGTSWDMPPLDELEAKLPGTIGDWRQAEPEVIRIPEEGKALTSYTKTAQVAYSRGDRGLLFWFVPLRYDTLFEEAEEGSAPRTRTIHQAENYRALLWAPDDPAEADPQFVKALREALTAYPRATLDEYPLPRAAPGGKILEDEVPE